MAEIFSLRPSEHDAVQKLMPWFVNGTLSAREARRVETHLAECGECREDLAFERQLAHDVAMLPLNADEGWKAMQLRMAEEAAPARATGPMRLFRRRVPVGWAMAGSLAASVALALVLTSAQLRPAPQQTYHTLGSAPANSKGQIVVLFKPAMTERQMRIVLTAQNARLVDGPTASGAYVLHVDSGNPADAIKALRQSSYVLLAEPLAQDGRP